MRYLLQLGLFAVAAAAYTPPLARQLGRRQLVVGTASLLSFGGVQKAEAVPGEIRKADQSKIGVSRVPDLKLGQENRGAGFAGKGEGQRKGVPLKYDYKTKTSVFGPSGAAGNSGPNGFFAGGEDFGGVSVGKKPLPVEGKGKKAQPAAAPADEPAAEPTA